MTAAEHHILILAMAWILGSIPMALLAFQLWLRKLGHAPTTQTIIPHEDEAPAGSFLDVPLPPPALPLPEETGVPVRQWKRLDGWVALGTVLLLGLLMGPLLLDPEKAAGFELNPGRMGVQIAFQLSLAGLLLFYLARLRHIDLTKLFGLRKYSFFGNLGRALAFVVPGMVGILIFTVVSMPYIQKWLGLDAASPQIMIKALQSGIDPLTGLLTFISACVAAPLMEELIFRGFLYGVAKRFTHASYAAVASALFFALIHSNVMSFLPLTLLGLLFVAAYESTRSLLVPVLMHMVFNTVQLTLLFLSPYLQRLAENLKNVQ